MNRAEAIAYLEEDGGATPGCIYGNHSEDCAPLAYVLARIVCDANGEPVNRDALDHAMGLVVNSHDDVQSLIREHGSAADIEALEEAIRW